ncbi:MAG: hypothetical protein JW797_07405, partial [Bradymonadales bacterium]|nr:hypothetical protein [Bradymonadales bacterium]
MKPMHTISLLGTQFGLLVLGLLLALCTTSQAGTILAEFRSNPPAGLPFELHGDVVGHAGVANPALLQVVEVDQAGNVIGTCTAQFNTWLGSGDSDFAGSAFFVPPEIRPPPRRFLIRSTGSAIPSDGEPLASTEGADVLVDNGHFTLRHPAAQGGLPERIDFASGAALTLEWEDRLYRADQGWFWPRADSQAEVTILANGELAAVVEVRARYLERNSGNAHPADPRLAYRFTYYADSPLVRLESSTSQASDFPWPELHVAHLSRPGVSSSASWAAANVTTTGYGQEATGGLPDLSRTLMATRWAAIWGASTATPPASVGLAVMLEGESEHSEHQVRLYSSADDSYNYLAGQWLRLDSLSAETLVWLGFYDLPELLPTIRSHWEQLSLVSPGRVLASGALSEVQAEREALPSFAPEQAVGRMLRHQLEELGRSAEQLDPYSEWQTRMEAWRQVNEQLTSSSARQASVELPWAGEGPTADTVYFVDRDYLLGFDGLNTLALAAIFHDASRTHFMAPGARASLFSAIFVEASEETASEATYRLDALRAQGADWTFDTEDRSLQLTYRRELEVPTDEVGASVTETVRAALTIQGDGASASLSGMV